jgi:CheY-like chemotaxis protein
VSHAVLVVEDDVDIRQALVEILEDHGFQAVGESNGADALEYLRRAPDLPCLILLDLMMPVMDGATFREAQRNDPRLASIPVVVLSAHRDLAAHVHGLDVVSVLRKPPNVRELVTVLHTHC